MQHAGKKNYIMLYTFYLLERKDINVTYIKHARKNERIKKLLVLYTVGVLGRTNYVIYILHAGKNGKKEINIYIHIHTYKYMHTYIQIHTYAYIYTHMHLHRHVHTYPLVHIHMRTNIPTYIYTHTYTHAHIHIQTHIHLYT